MLPYRYFIVDADQPGKKAPRPRFQGLGKSAEAGDRSPEEEAELLEWKEHRGCRSSKFLPKFLPGACVLRSSHTAATGFGALMRLVLETREICRAKGASLGI